jgi:hypothetical protein
MTYTINMAATPKAIHAGGNTLAWDFNSGATVFGTLSDVLLLGKIPSGALIDMQGVRFGATKQANAHFALELLAVEAQGTFSLWATLIASMTASSTAAAQFQSYIPKKVSLSDDRAVQYVVAALNTTTGPSESASFSCQGFIHYTTDGSSV